MNKKIHSIFKKFGLVDSQITLYMSLLQNRGKFSPASAIALRNGFDRNTTRHNCDQLVKRGFLKCKRDGKTYLYTAEPPERVLDLIKVEEKKINEWKKDFKRNLGYLNAIMNPDALIPGAEFYNGFEGVVKVYEDTLTEGKEIFCYENIEHMTAEMKEYILKDYIPRRAANNIFIKVLSPDNPSHQKTRSEDKKFNRETRFISENEFKLQIEVNIYGNKCAFFSYKSNEMFAVIVESKSIAESMKMIFMNIWNQAK